jgi:sortase A
MPIYRYVKHKPRIKIRPPQVFSFALIFVGMIIISWVVWPIISFQYVSSQIFSSIISPVADNDLAASLKLKEVVMAAGESVPTSENYYIDPNVWYPDRPQKKSVAPVDFYTLSIPKLNIKNAKVVIGGDSLDEHLIHYGGTALPGSNGTSVIFGHSTLPQLYDPKNYKTIFSFLPTLKPVSDDYAGDEILITFENITYRYVVYDMKVLKPNNFSVLDQNYDGSFLTLVTCVPPGTYWERLNVRAKLVALK